MELIRGNIYVIKCIDGVERDARCLYGYNYEGQACMKLFEPYEIEGKKLLYAFPKKEQVVRAM